MRTFKIIIDYKSNPRVLEFSEGTRRYKILQLAVSLRILFVSYQLLGVERKIFTRKLLLILSRNSESEGQPEKKTGVSHEQAPQERFKLENRQTKLSLLGTNMGVKNKYM